MLHLGDRAMVGVLTVLPLVARLLATTTSSSTTTWLGLASGMRVTLSVLILNRRCFVIGLLVPLDCAMRLVALTSLSSSVSLASATAAAFEGLLLPLRPLVLVLVLFTRLFADLVLRIVLKVAVLPVAGLLALLGSAVAVVSSTSLLLLLVRRLLLTLERRLFSVLERRLLLALERGLFSALEGLLLASLEGWLLIALVRRLILALIT